jgi:pyruvate/2-oxoglutarate dehydrogenase complex dihydrolipoamide dehydrogenase (E3) component
MFLDPEIAAVGINETDAQVAKALVCLLLFLNFNVTTLFF